MSFSRKNIYIIVAGLICAWAQDASAASLLVAGPTTTARIGGLFAVDVLIDAEGTNVNAISGSLSFPSDLLSVASISTEHSVITFWLDEPKEKRSLWAHSGEIRWSGIIPGGFDGVLSPSYSGSRPGTVLRVIFAPTHAGTASLLLGAADIRLNDGHATPTVASSTPFTLSIADAPAGSAQRLVTAKLLGWGILVISLCALLFAAVR